VIVPETVALVAASAVGICLLATLWPARIAARVQPADGLRYE
jgi:lipoprotein-releasing system permease protein